MYDLVLAAHGPARQIRGPAHKNSEPAHINPRSRGPPYNVVGQAESYILSGWAGLGRETLNSDGPCRTAVHYKKIRWAWPGGPNPGRPSSAGP